MKKTVAILLIAVLALSAVACGKAETPATEDGQKKLSLGGLKGATSIGMVSLLEGGQYDFTMAASADELTPKLLKGELDAAAVPSNLASVLYNRSGGKLQVAAITTLGLLYIVEKGGETVKSVKDLQGKTLYATGKDAAPEYALRYLLEQNGLALGKDVTVAWKSEPSEIVSRMATEENSVAMLPQPFVEAARAKLPDLRIALDTTASWAATGKEQVTAVLVVQKDLSKEAVGKLLEDYGASTEYVNSHPEEAGGLVEKYGITKADVAEKAIPYCNMVCITGAAMQEKLSGYLQVLCDMKPEAIGGSMPGEDFYFGK